jgi:hypothetical protein
MKWHWYLTIDAIRQFMAAADMSGEVEAGNPDFELAEELLGQLSLTARKVDAPQSASGALLYRGWVEIPGVGRTHKDRAAGHKGRRRRVECTVMPAGRAEGDLPQLVRVRLK